MSASVHRCGRCRNEGHNARSCTAPVDSEKPPRVSDTQRVRAFILKGEARAVDIHRALGIPVERVANILHGLENRGLAYRSRKGVNGHNRRQPTSLWCGIAAPGRSTRAADGLTERQQELLSHLVERGGTAVLDRWKHSAIEALAARGLIAPDGWEHRLTPAGWDRARAGGAS